MSRGAPPPRFFSAVGRVGLFGSVEPKVASFGKREKKRGREDKTKQRL